MLFWKNNRNKDQFVYPGSEVKWLINKNFYKGILSSTDLEVRQSRITITATIFAFIFIALSFRLIDLMMVDVSLSQSSNSSNFIKVGSQSRADILDRNGWAIATNVPTVHLYANSREIIDPHQVVSVLLPILPKLNKGDLLRKLKSRQKFIYIKRHISPSKQLELNTLGIPGLYFEKSERRVYPYGSLFAHVVGTTDLDNNGTSGLEAKFNNILENENESLILSLDVGIQNIVRRSLSSAKEKFNAIGAAAIVMDVRTAEIISLVSLPDFDPGYSSKPNDIRRFNRVTLGRYEMGSTFKLFTFAMAIETKAINMQSMFDATQPIVISGEKIDDYLGKRRWLSAPEVLIYSSNIGATKIAQRVGSENQKFYLNEFGLLSMLDLEVPELASPKFPRQWRDINIATISYGHGIAVTPVHVASAVGSIVNGGFYRNPTLIKKISTLNNQGPKILSLSTSLQMRQLMRLVVRNGSGRNADIPGYLVGGKTGSANKNKDGEYIKDKMITSFVSAFPINQPRYVVLVLLDEPRPLKETNYLATAGWNAVPTAGKIIKQIAPLLNIYPLEDSETNSEPFDLIKIDSYNSNPSEYDSYNVLGN